jgi:hypothetical protein
MPLEEFLNTESLIHTLSLDQATLLCIPAINKSMESENEKSRNEMLLYAGPSVYNSVTQIKLKSDLQFLLHVKRTQKSGSYTMPAVCRQWLQ